MTLSLTHAKVSSVTAIAPPTALVTPTDWNAQHTISAAGLSVLGVTGSAATSVADITGTANQVLRVDSAGSTLAFGAINLASTSAVAGILGGANGGTGVNNGTSTITVAGNFTVATNGGTLAFGAASKTLTVNNSLTLAGADATTMTFPSASDTVMGLGAAQAVTGNKTFNSGTLLLAGATSGTIILKAAAVAGANTITLPAGTTDFSATGGAGQYVKQSGAGAALTVGTITATDLPGSFSGFANPTASIGLTAVNGVATTAMRSDGAPALSQAIAPTWSATHIFSAATMLQLQSPSVRTWSLSYDGTQNFGSGSAVKALKLSSDLPSPVPIWVTEYGILHVGNVFAQQPNLSPMSDSTGPGIRLFGDILVGDVRSFGDLVTTVTGAVNNGSGLIRLTASTTGLATGNVIQVGGVGGVPNATGVWTITVIDGTHMDLQGSTFAGSFTTNGWFGTGANSMGLGWKEPGAVPTSTRLYSGSDLNVDGTGGGYIIAHPDSTLTQCADPGALELVAYGSSGSGTYFNKVRIAARNGVGTITDLAVLGTSGITCSVNLTVATVFGGSAAGSTLNLQSTSNGAPSGDKITMTTGGSVRWTMLSSGNIGFGTETNPTQGFWTYSKNVSTGFSASGVTTNGLVFVGADSASGGYATFTFAQAGINQFMRAEGTGASPTALGAGSLIGGIVAGGATGAATWTSATKGRILFVSTESGVWSSTNQGCGIEFDTTAAGGTTRAQAMLLKAGLIIGAGTTDPGAGALQASAGITSTGATSGIGYATGAGGTVTQATSRTTGVTLNNVTGAITLVSAAGSASFQSFTVSNTAVAATDVIKVNQKSGTDKYEIFVTNIAAGSFQITFATTGGTTTEQPVFQFVVIKGANA